MSLSQDLRGFMVAPWPLVGSPHSPASTPPCAPTCQTPREKPGHHGPPSSWRLSRESTAQVSALRASVSTSVQWG